MRKMQKSDISIIAVLAFTLVSDRLSKWAVAAGMELGESFPVIPHILNFTYVHNRGASFGILADKRWVYMLLSAVALVVMTAVPNRLIKLNMVIWDRLYAKFSPAEGSPMPNSFLSRSLGKGRSARSEMRPFMYLRNMWYKISTPMARDTVVEMATPATPSGGMGPTP